MMSILAGVIGAPSYTGPKPIDWSISQPRGDFGATERKRLRAAAVQLNSTGDKDRNLEAAERLVRAAASDGAELVALPEKWNLLAGGEELLAGAEPLDGPSLERRPRLGARAGRSTCSPAASRSEAGRRLSTPRS